MGAGQATVYAAGKPLIPQRNFEGTIHRRFVKNTVVTLELQDQFWNKPRDHTIEIRDVAHDKLLFKVPPVSATDRPSKRKLLLDAYGVPVVGTEEHEMPPDCDAQKQFAVIPNGFAATKEVFRFETRFTPFSDMKLRLFLADHTPDAPSRVVVMGRWPTREAAFAIQQNGGSFYMIARVYAVGSLLDGTYRMDIAPGVDLALLVLFAGVMDQESVKYLTSPDRVRFRQLVKQHSKQEAKKLKAQQSTSIKSTNSETTANVAQAS